MTPQLTQLLVFVGAIAGIVALIWAAQNAARMRGQAEQRANDQADARSAEGEMTEIQGETITPDELRDRIRKGTFGGQDP